MDVEHVEGSYDITGGTGYWQAWIPATAPRAVVVVVHGFGEHGGRYDHVGRRLARDGFATYAADHRGHGRTSVGRRANIDRMATVVDDLAGFAALTAQRHPDVRRVVLGHSLGALISLQFATSKPAGLAGLVLTGAAVQVEIVSPLVIRVAKIAATVAPNLGTIALPPEDVSRDPAVVEAYRADPLVHHGKIPARTGAEIVAATLALPDRLPRLHVPVLIVHGSEDRLAPPAGSELVHERVGSPDRTLRLLDGLSHEVMNEPEQAAVLDEIARWISEHVR